MVEIIGLTTVIALIWLLASAMATESEADRRRLSRATGNAVSVEEEEATGTETRHAA